MAVPPFRHDTSRQTGLLRYLLRRRRAVREIVRAGI